ncbi:hypothetical protein CASFOL_006670 [Castilleja foliolosa]|uniref:Uncharacterized protein n=1 Tax=Castilleja foliolosa TaxID=1961234 RepID=A0ABD3E7W9_9LAMI
MDWTLRGEILSRCFSASAGDGGYHRQNNKSTGQNEAKTGNRSPAKRRRR